MRRSKEPADKAGLPKMMTSIQVAEASVSTGPL
jgi:hypothetical protein